MTYSLLQVGDGLPLGEGALGDHGDVVAVEGEDAEAVEAGEGVLVDALDVVVADDERREPGQVGEDKGGQRGHLVVAHVPRNEIVSIWSRCRAKSQFGSSSLRASLCSQVML